MYQLILERDDSLCHSMEEGSCEGRLSEHFQAKVEKGHLFIAGLTYRDKQSPRLTITAMGNLE